MKNKKMSLIHKQLFFFYKVFRVSSAVNEDIKIIKRFNYLQKKYKSTNDKKFHRESINIVKTLNNLFSFTNECEEFIKYTFIAEEYHKIFEGVLDEIKNR